MVDVPGLSLLSSYLETENRKERVPYLIAEKVKAMYDPVGRREMGECKGGVGEG